MKASAKTFDAVLEKDRSTLGWTVARLPFDPLTIWPERIRLRVKGTVNGAMFRSSLFADTTKPGSFFLLVNRSVQAAAKTALGSRVSIIMEPDLDPRPAELPDELDALLDDEPGLRAWYDALTEYTCRQIGTWVMDVKSDEARARRAQTMAERMFATMEAEQELPPAVRKALDARPKARQGWAVMTPSQRRMELFAVSYYQSPEASAKRIAKLCDEAEKAATRAEKRPAVKVTVTRRTPVKKHAR